MDCAMERGTYFQVSIVPSFLTMLEFHDWAKLDALRTNGVRLNLCTYELYLGGVVDKGQDL